MTTVQQIASWFDRGVTQGATHMIVVCDTFSYEDYPVYAMLNKQIQEVAEKYGDRNMQKIMEVYDLR